MPKLIIMQGLPASGKSTRAQEILQQSGNSVRINKDLLRTMLHFNKWSGPNESLTREASRTLAKTFLAMGKNVVIDDTNLNLGTLQSWKDLAKECNATHTIERIDTDVKTCLKRDLGRDKTVGSHVIIQMALQNGLYPKPEKGIILCDIDGTLADTSHRLHFVNRPEGEKKDWKGFFEAMPEDKPRHEVMATVSKHASLGYEIFLVSARPETYRIQTEAWLFSHFGTEYKALFMRGVHDSRPDTEVKKEILNKYFPDLSWIRQVIDDRPSVIRMWREQGLNVVDVGSGIEF